MKLVYRKNAVLILCLIVFIAVLAAPFLFTHFGLGYFEHTGQVGDTIGGTTAPLIGLLSAVLIYLSFQQQIKANKLQHDSVIEIAKQYDKDKRLNYVNDWTNEIEMNIDELSIELNLQFLEIYDGKEAVKVLSSSWYEFGAPNTDFFKKSIDDEIPEKLVNVCQNIISLRSYIKQYHLEEYSFNASRIPAWIELFEGLEDQVEKVIKGKPLRERSGNAYRDYYLPALTDKKQKAFQILHEKLQALKPALN